ncbi:flagellar hook assembly protein FlgD [Candidatus Nitrospira bockiana]
MATISDMLGATGSTTQTTASTDSGRLGKDEFLNLLVTQLQYQDPLNPTDNETFITQAAMFSQLEQLTKLVDLAQELVDQNQAAGTAQTSRTA